MGELAGLQGTSRNNMEKRELRSDKAFKVIRAAPLQTEGARTKTRRVVSVTFASNDRFQGAATGRGVSKMEKKEKQNRDT